MNINQLKNSNFLKKEDVEPAKLVTIEDCSQVNVAKEGAPEEMRWALYFKEMDKPLILNSTNGQIIAKITGSEESDDWYGQKIVLYHDPNVSFGGKLVGGIRVRAPKPGAKPSPAAAPEEEPDETEIPF